MESELKSLNPDQTHEPQVENKVENQMDDDSSTKDDRPLLKSEHISYPVSTLSIEELEVKYAPFVRRDVYGIMGRGELPWLEKVLIGFSLVTLVPVRLMLATTTLLIYYFICKMCTAFSVPNREDEQEDYAHIGGWRRAVIVQTGKFLSRVVLFIFGFYFIRETYLTDDSGANTLAGKNEIEANSKDQSQKSERPGVVVGNHVSYLDILYHTSSCFPSFVAKRSVGKLPLIGHISKCLGCVFVQRESKTSDSKGVSGIVNDRIKEAHQSESAPMMMLFPEGTTTNGDFLLPFKTGAFLSGAPVLPVILRYPFQRLSPAWDSISGMRHLFFLLCQFANYMEVTKLPIYYPSQAEKSDPKIFAENIRKLMAHEGNLALSDIGLAEKRVYHAALKDLLF